MRRNRDLIRAVVVTLLAGGFGALLLGGGFAVCRAAGAADAASPSGSLRVVASIFPLADIARQVGGDAVQVEVLLPPGATPHDFEPSPAQAEILAQADLLLVVGMGADPWARESAIASGNQGLGILVFSQVVDLNALPLMQPGDPHIWLDPVLVKQFAAVLEGVFGALHPQEAGSVRERAAGFRGALETLDQEYRERLGGTSHKAFAVLHSAFSYVAARYGLEQAAVLDAHLHEPGPHGLEHVVHFIRERQVKVLFVQPQIPASSVAWLQEQTGVRIGALDPLGSPLRDGYDNYLNLMRSNLDELVSALNE